MDDLISCANFPFDALSI